MTPTFSSALDHVYQQALQKLDSSYAEPLERGYKLAYNGHIQPSDRPQCWDVTGSTGSLYIVAHTADGWQCTCPDHQYRHHPCYHVLGCQLFIRAMQTVQAAAQAISGNHHVGNANVGHTNVGNHTNVDDHHVGNANVGHAHVGHENISDHTNVDDHHNIKNHHHGASLPEAPASVNCHITLEGRQVQLTLRDTDEARLLARLAQVLRQYPMPVVESSPKEKLCPKHQVPMKQNQKDGRSWWSHRQPSGEYCQGR